MNKWYLVNIVNNDFHQEKEIFRIFNGLRIENMEKVVGTESQTNGIESNGHLAEKQDRPLQQNGKVIEVNGSAEKALLRSEMEQMQKNQLRN